MSRRTALPGRAPRLRSGLADLPASADVLVVGLGVTGAGVALDAASRGLSVVAVDAEDVGFGTSRWSSKLVHGGLRYLARGQLGVAHESAVERGLLMEVTAPHLTRPLPMLLPLHPPVGRAQAALAGAGLWSGDLLRLVAGTSRSTLPRPRHLTAAETLRLTPAVRQAGLRGGMLSWDGQLEDDARLVVALARTAVREGAVVHRRVRARSLTGSGAVLEDPVTGRARTFTARAVVNATGVWAGTLVPDVRLRPSRGTHLVLPGRVLAGSPVAVTAPVPGETNRFCFALPQSDGTVYAGLTDVPVDHLEHEPTPTEEEIGFLLEVLGRVLERPPARGAVIGAYAGLRPLLGRDDRPHGATADLSRRHAVLMSSAGVITVVGGKLTTYRRMAEDAVDAAVSRHHLGAGPCRTRRLPLVGAAPADVLARTRAPARLVRRFGTEAPDVLAHAVAVTGLPAHELLAPPAPSVPVTLAELVFGVTHEGATTVADLLDRRTRVGLVPEHRDTAAVLAHRALDLAAAWG